MNNRIQELAKQVWPDPSVSHTNHEKFAELLIQECCQVIQEWKKEPFPFDEATAIQIIKDHFKL